MHKLTLNFFSNPDRFPLAYFLNPDPDRFKTCATFKPTFQIPIPLKLELPLSSKLL
jgi:hypothetical protein